MSEEFWTETEDPAADTAAEDTQDQDLSAPAADEDDLAGVLQNVPPEQQDVMRRYAKDVERRLHGKFGSRIGAAERAAAEARELAYRLQQSAPQPTKAQTQELDENARNIRAELEKIVPELSALKDVESMKDMLRQNTVNHYELAVDNYLNTGPAKVFGDAFTTQHRETLKAVIRAAGYNTNHPAVVQAQTLIRDMLRGSVEQRKNQAINRANAGFETRSFNPSETAPSIAKLTEGGDFDWEATYDAAQRRRLRGG